MFKLLIVALLVILGITCQEYSGCPGTPNNQPLIQGDFKLVGQVQNGKKYVAPYDGRLFYILNLNGSAYEMGYAYGQLMKDEIPETIDTFADFTRWIIMNNVSSIIPKLPKAYRTWIQDTAITIAQGLLSLNWYIVQPYTNKRWNEEMQGMADASGVNIWYIRQINMMPELLKASCSILGSYGKSSSTGKLFHLRSLDWEQHAKMSKWPTITVYHSTESGSIPFANVGWPVMIGSLTGYNSAKVGVGERLGGSAAVNQSRFGTPWMFVLRDALQFSKSQQQYIQYLENAHRTCSIYLGIGGENCFSIIKYAYGYLETYNWTNWTSGSKEDALWKAYKNEPCFESIISKNYGNVTSETIYRLIAPMAQTGDSQVAVMDYSNDTMVVMYPNPVTFNPGFNAPPIYIDLKPYFG